MGKQKPKLSIAHESPKTGFSFGKKATAFLLQASAVVNYLMQRYLVPNYHKQLTTHQSTHIKSQTGSGLHFSCYYLSL